MGALQRKSVYGKRGTGSAARSILSTNIGGCVAWLGRMAVQFSSGIVAAVIAVIIRETGIIVGHSDQRWAIFDEALSCPDMVVSVHTDVDGYVVIGHCGLEPVAEYGRSCRNGDVDKKVCRELNLLREVVRGSNGSRRSKIVGGGGNLIPL